MGGRKKTKIKDGWFGKGQAIAVVLNLDSKSPNCNTIALYKDGKEAGDPVALPEDLQGKTLYPHLTYRKASVQVNFGPSTLKDLPFKCRLLQDAASSDVSVAPPKEPKDGKYDVCMPVAFPDEGTFEWLDAFLEKNPQYVELSDRKLLAWANASGLLNNAADRKGSNDKPNWNFGIREMDDFSIRKVAHAIAPAMPRNYLIMEVKSNLIASERQEVLKRFNYPCYKKTAHVMIGEPNKEYKALVHAKILKDKQAKSDMAFKQKKAETARKKAAEKRQKEIAEAKAKKEAEKKKKEEEAKAKKAAEDAKKEGKEGEEKKEEEKKEDEPMEEKKEEPVAEAEDEETEPPVVELTEEERKMSHAPKKVHDLSMSQMNSFYSKFSIPEKDDGFDDIIFEWQKSDKAQSYLKDWIFNKKLTTRIEDIKPGQLFKDKKAEFQKVLKEWQDKLAKAPKKAKKKADDEEEDVDIFSVADVNDVGAGVPLFSQFTYEDWELLKLRFHFALLVLSFKQDCNDSDRTGIPMDHVSFYWNKYYSDNLSPKKYGMAEVKEVLSMIKETVCLKDGLLVSQLSDGLDSLDVFVKLTEEHRRERQRRIDAGDETARLKFAPPEQPKPKPESKADAKPADPKAAAAKPAVSAAKGGASAKGGSAKGTVPPSGGKGAKDAAKGAGGKDQQKGSGKGEQKGWGKDAQQKGWGKDKGDAQKGWGKDKGASQQKGKGKDSQKGWGKDQGGKDKSKGWGKSKW